MSEQEPVLNPIQLIDKRWLVRDVSEEEIARFERVTCEWFEQKSGYCEFYSGLCFHYPTEFSIPGDICYKVRPRTEVDLMEWMDPMFCSDCNGVTCNGCDIYGEYMREGYFKSREKS